MANNNSNEEGALPPRSQQRGLPDQVFYKTIEAAQDRKAKTCLRSGSYRSWLFLLGVYEDAVRCPTACTDEQQKARIASDKSNLRDTISHKLGNACTLEAMRFSLCLTDRRVFAI
jgi:hypothetical protein